MSGERKYMPDRWQEIIPIMIAAMAQLPENHPDVVSAGERCSDHIAQEVIVIRECERQRRIVR